MCGIFTYMDQWYKWSIWLFFSHLTRLEALIMNVINMCWIFADMDQWYKWSKSDYSVLTSHFWTRCSLAFSLRAVISLKASFFLITICAKHAHVFKLMSHHKLSVKYIYIYIHFESLFLSYHHLCQACTCISMQVYHFFHFSMQVYQRKKWFATECWDKKNKCDRMTPFFLGQCGCYCWPRGSVVRQTDRDRQTDRQTD